MGLYQQIEKMEDLKQLKKYENLLEEIKYYFDSYKDVINVSEDFDSKISYCLLNGRRGIEYYLKEYLDSSVADPSFLYLTSEVEDYAKNVQRMNKNLPMLLQIATIISEVSHDKLSSANVNSLINYLSEESNKDSKLFKNKQIQAFLLFIGLNTIPEYQSIFASIEDKYKERTSNNENPIKVLITLLQENNIELDERLLLNHFKEVLDKKPYLENKLREEFPSKFIQNKFIYESMKLKESVQSKLKEGSDRERVLREILPKAYALAKLAYKSAVNQDPYDVQLIGAMALNDGYIAEMKTGEGKTLTAFLVAYLNALTGEGVDVITTNDYLANRDYIKNKGAFNLLGVSVGNVKVDDQNIEEKKNAYKCDVVYGSSNAIAFDYLRDLFEEDSKNTVLGDRIAGKCIIDEADQILINNALSPYQLNSGEKISTNKQKEDNIFIKENLKLAFEIERVVSNSSYVTSSVEEFKYLVESKKENKDIKNKIRNNSIIVLKSDASGKGEIYLTPRGEAEIFYYAMLDDIMPLSTKAKDFFENNPKYVKDVDYLSSKERLVLTVSGLEKAVKEVKEFSDLEQNWLTNEKCLIMRRYVCNALRARHLMVRGRDYEVGYNKQTDQNEVFVLQDGRILPDSKFTEGLHQAIELKEGLDISIREDANVLDNSLASISNRGLLYRYKSRCGMTGTADKSAFSAIYGMDTFNVPTNKEYLYKKDSINNKPPLPVVERPTELYISKREKIQAIVEDIVESNKKGQPVLVVTDNSEEAKLIYETIQELNLTGKANLLIAGKNLEEENKIIAQAGVMGAITIATEMAGRGTDIKLGGEKNIDKTLILEEELKTEAICKWLHDKGYSIKDNFSNAKEAIAKNPKLIEKDLVEVKKLYNTNTEYKKTIDSSVEEKSSFEINKLYEIGGLKYIQTKPFKTSRNDRQGRGRVGRQGEPGETIMYACFEDLERLGVPLDEQNKLYSLFGKNSKERFINDADADGKISDAITDAQNVNEFAIDMQIASTDSMDLATSSIGAMLLNTRKQLLETEDMTIVFDNMINSTIDSLIKDNVPLRKQKKVDKLNSRISRLHLDSIKFNSDIEKIFGIDIEPEEIFKNCTDIADIKLFIRDKVYDKKKSMDIGFSDSKINNRIKSVLVEQLSNTYNNFIESARDINLQQMNDFIAQNFQHDRSLELSLIYNECKKECWYNSIRSIFKPGLKEKENNSGVVFPSQNDTNDNYKISIDNWTKK